MRVEPVEVIPTVIKCPDAFRDMAETRTSKIPNIQLSEMSMLDATLTILSVPSSIVDRAVYGKIEKDSSIIDSWIDHHKTTNFKYQSNRLDLVAQVLLQNQLKKADISNTFILMMSET